MSSKEELPTEFKPGWKFSSQYTMDKTKKRLDAALSLYKKNYNNGPPKKSEENKSKHFVYIRSERKDPKEHRHKLAPVIEGPFEADKLKATKSLSKKRIKLSKEYYNQL